jgi:hypothetical protein
LPINTNYPDNGYMKSFYIVNYGTADLTIQTDVTETFLRGHRSYYLKPNAKLQLGIIYGLPYDYISSSTIHVNTFRTTNWANGNFAAVTAIPFESVTYEDNDEILDVDIAGAPTRITCGIDGTYYIRFQTYFLSTNNSAFTVTAGLYKNGVEVITFDGGGDGNSGVCIGMTKFTLDCVATDYLEVKVKHTGLTGNLTYAVFSAEINL